MDLLEGEARRRATGIKEDVYYAGRVVGTRNVYDSRRAASASRRC